MMEEGYAHDPASDALLQSDTLSALPSLETILPDAAVAHSTALSFDTWE